MLLAPIYLVILIITSLEYRHSNYLEKDLNSSSVFANKKNYLDMLIEDGDFPGDVVIPSKVITKSYLNVFIPFSEPSLISATATMF